ncbi:hypothetical protein EPN87_04005 [archaeon]|nr:MAG: hypothetical protein EPN87_04005 [archaeon]
MKDRLKQIVSGALLTAAGVSELYNVLYDKQFFAKIEPLGDKGYHLSTSYALATVGDNFLRRYTQRKWLVKGLVIGGVVAAGVLKEVWDSYRGDSADPLDFAADISGIIAYTAGDTQP